MFWSHAMNSFYYFKTDNGRFSEYKNHIHKVRLDIQIGYAQKAKDGGTFHIKGKEFYVMLVEYGPGFIMPPWSFGSDLVVEHCAPYFFYYRDDRDRVIKYLNKARVHRRKQGRSTVAYPVLKTVIEEDNDT